MGLSKQNAVFYTSKGIQHYSERKWFAHLERMELLRKSDGGALLQSPYRY